MIQTVVSGFIYDTDVDLILKSINAIVPNSATIKPRIFGQQIDYEDENIEIFIEEVLVNSDNKRSNYTVSMTFEKDLNTTQTFLRKFANFLSKNNIKYEFEYNEIIDNTEGEEYQLYYPET